MVKSVKSVDESAVAPSCTGPPLAVKVTDVHEALVPAPVAGHDTLEVENASVPQPL
jgi:hypothetical protein